MSLEIGSQGSALSSKPGLNHFSRLTTTSQTHILLIQVLSPTSAPVPMTPLAITGRYPELHVLSYLTHFTLILPVTE